MAEQKLSVIPIVDEYDNYQGLVTQGDLIQFYASSFSFMEPGSILIIETNRNDYSLAEIARIIESENAGMMFGYEEGGADFLNNYIKFEKHKTSNKRFERKIISKIFKQIL